MTFGFLIGFVAVLPLAFWLGARYRRHLEHKRWLAGILAHPAFHDVD